MLRTGLHRVSGVRCISSNHRIIERNVLRKIKKGVDRLPSQGPDPAAQFKHGWQLASAAMLERYPVVSPDPHPFIEEYETNRFLDAQKRARPIPPSFFLTEKDIVEGKTEPSFEDKQAELYTPGPRVTEADHRNDTKSLERALPERLYFLIRRSAKSKHMQFPQMLAKDDNVTMMRYAQNALNSVTNPETRPKVHFLSHSPSCHLEHVYSLKYQQKHDVYGVKIFFYRAMLMSGNIQKIRNGVDYAWARDCELRDLLGDESYRAVKPALLGVGPTIRPDT